MREKRKPKKDKSATSESRWDVNVQFTKSMFHGGGRGAVVTVTDRLTNKSLKRSATAGTKNELRIVADKLASVLIAEL